METIWFLDELILWSIICQGKYFLQKIDAEHYQEYFVCENLQIDNTLVQQNKQDHAPNHVF
ncbi:hypothetical protein Fmac_029765 [Flemingia macrophylla]|uniref:Uncharacterized protein n=1 Tax=Flemingia macrophylla TaxID=520843 RepID=A0ABD1LBE3_9FABA